MAMDLRPLDAYLPPDTRPLLERWLNDSTCRLVVKGPRKTKRGDFRPGQRGQVPTLTINVDLKPLQFLLTLTHEIAHLLVWQNCGHLRQPHGPIGSINLANSYSNYPRLKLYRSIIGGHWSGTLLDPKHVLSETPN